MPRAQPCPDPFRRSVYMLWTGKRGAGLPYVAGVMIDNPR